MPSDASTPDLVALLARIADALDRLAPARPTCIDWDDAPAYVWAGANTRAIAHFEAPPLALLQGIDSQKARVVANVSRLAAGHSAHDMLLWGSRGMGKSALLRAAVRDAQVTQGSTIALVQVGQDALAGVTELFAQLGEQARRFLVFIDDLGFDDADASGPRLLRSWLEGGVQARPANVRLAVTANHRAIVSRSMSEQDDPISVRDVRDDRLALADRFGLSVGFHNCSQEDYLAIVAGYAEAVDLAWESADALEWAQRRGGRSGRVAWQYIAELAGRAGKPL